MSLYKRKKIKVPGVSGTSSAGWSCSLQADLPLCSYVSDKDSKDDQASAPGGVGASKPYKLHDITCVCHASLQAGCTFDNH